MLTSLAWLGVVIGLWCIAAALVATAYAAIRGAGHEVFFLRDR